MSARPEGPPPMFLFVEDVEAERYVFRKAFEAAASRGRLVTAGSAREALEMLRQGLRPRLILLDYVLPETTGDEFLAELRVDPALRSIPVLVVSGMADPAVIRRMHQQGIVAYLRKPSGLQETVGLARAILDLFCHPALIPAPALAGDGTPDEERPPGG